MDLRQARDGSVRVYSDVEGLDLAFCGRPKTPPTGGGSGSGGGNCKYRLQSVSVIPLAAASGSGGVIAWQPENTAEAYICIDTVLDVTTAAPASTTLNVGTAANGTTSSSNLMSAQAVSSTGTFTSTSVAKLTAGQFITATANQTPTGLVGNLYVTVWAI